MRLRGHTRPCYNVVEIWPTRSTSTAATRSTAARRSSASRRRRWPTRSTCRCTGAALMRPRVLALVDGEHYPPVVRAALEQAARGRRGGGGAAAGRHREAGRRPRLRRAAGAAGGSTRRRRWLAAAGAPRRDRVLDLSDEPVLTERAPARAGLPTRVAAGLATAGADFELRPPPREPTRRARRGRDRHRQADRQDGRVGAHRAAAASGRPRCGDRGDGPRRPAASRNWSTAREPSDRLDDLLARARPGSTPPPTSSRTPCWHGRDDGRGAPLRRRPARRAYLSNVVEAARHRGAAGAGPGAAGGLGCGGAAGGAPTARCWSPRPPPARWL